MSLWLVSLFLLFLLLSLVSFIWTFAPYFPTRHRDFARVDAVIDLEPGQNFYELGCGDASVSIYFARKYPKVNFVGYEIFLPIYLVAKLRSLFVPNLQIYYRNVLWQDLNDADWVYVFGMKDGIILKVRDKLIADLKPGAKVISYVFKIPDWPGTEEIYKIEKGAKIYVYTK